MRIWTDAETRPPLEMAKGRIRVTIPSYDSLTPEQREHVDAGGRWPILLEDYLEQHTEILDFLVEGALKAWKRSRA